MRKRQNKPRNDHRGGKILSALCSFLGILILVCVIAILSLVYLPGLFGRGVYHVVTGSMEPGIPVGSMVITEQTDPSSVKEGDVIAFQMKDSVVVHRVRANNSGEETFTTKGDANPIEDLSPVPYRDLIGKVTTHVPVMGRVLAGLTTLEGKIKLFLVIGAAFLFMVVGGRLRKRAGSDSQEDGEGKREDSEGS